MSLIICIRIIGKFGLADIAIVNAYQTKDIYCESNGGFPKPFISNYSVSDPDKIDKWFDLHIERDIEQQEMSVLFVDGPSAIRSVSAGESVSAE